MARVDILNFDSCSNVDATAERIRAVAARLGVEIDLRFVRVASVEDAVRERFLGSPTVRVNGVDIDPSSLSRSDFGLSCRVYGSAGVPPEAMIAEALQGVASGSSGDRAGLAAAGSVIAAALSSACCWLPLVFIAAGLSAGGISLAFAPLRPWLIVLAVVALSYGVWSTERQARASDACACAPVPRRRHILNRFTLAISALGVVAFALFPQYVDAVFGERPPVTSSRAAKQVTLRVEGMTCSGCETGIETALRRLPGVVLADASYGDGTVLVGLSPDATFGTDALIQAIAQAGYSVDSLESTPPREKANTRSSSVQVLGDDLEPLVASFNVASKQFRFLAILSPT